MIHGSSEANRDLLWVETSADGVNWTKKQLFTDQGECKFTPCFDLSGPIEGWKLVQVDLAALEGSPSALFRFRFTSDPSNPGEGFYIDDVTVRRLPKAATLHTPGHRFPHPMFPGWLL